MNKQRITFFSKPDEMEMAISYRAMRLTWIIINIVFVVMAIVFFMNGGQNPISLLTLLAAEALYLIIKSCLGWRMTRGGEDNE